MIARSYDNMKHIASKYQGHITQSIKIIKCDVTKPAEIISACAEINSWSNDNINLLLNNASGPAKIGSDLQNISIDDWNSDVDLNLRSSFIFTKQLISSLRYESENP